MRHRHPYAIRIRTLTQSSMRHRRVETAHLNASPSRKLHAGVRVVWARAQRSTADARRRSLPFGSSHPADPSLPTRPCRPVPAVLKRVMRGDVDACAVLVAPTISALARCGRTVALTCPSRSSTRPDGVDQITRSRMPRMNQSARAGGIESTDRAALKRHIYSPTNSAIWRTRQSTNPPVHQPASPPTRQSTNLAACQHRARLAWIPRRGSG